MEANNYGCITEALTVAAMLSAETTLLPGQRLSHLKFIDSFTHTLLIKSNMLNNLTFFWL